MKIIPTKGWNQHTKRMLRTMKEELFWIKQWSGCEQINQKLDVWVQYYNHDYLHSALNWKSPIQAEENYYKNEAYSPLIAA